MFVIEWLKYGVCVYFVFCGGIDVVFVLGFKFIDLKG